MPGERDGLPNAQWARLLPLLPTNDGQEGKPWGDHRRSINGILWKLRTGAPRRDVPARYGPWSTCADRSVRWRRDGTWARLLQAVHGAADASGGVDWEASLDRSVIRATSTPPAPATSPAGGRTRGASTRTMKRSAAAAAG